MALIPFIWLVWRWDWRPEWWWLAFAFAMSWLADTAAHWVSPWFPAALYPISQAAIVGCVLMPRTDARHFMFLLVMVGLLAVLWEGVDGPAVLLPTIAAGSVVVIAWWLPRSRLRVMLLTAFGGTGLAWIGYAIEPGWVTWGLYQCVRAVSIGMFCWASVRPVPRLRLV